MFVDGELQFHDEALEASVATHVGQVGAVDQIYDTGANINDIGDGEPLELVVQVTTDVEGTTSTVDFQYVQSANADLSSPDVLASTGAIAEATLVAGYEWRTKVPPNTKRYVGFQYVNAVNVLTAGVVNAQIVKDAQTNR